MVAIFADGLTTVTRQGATKMKMIVNEKTEFIGHYIVYSQQSFGERIHTMNGYVAKRSSDITNFLVEVVPRNS